jgi:hypothetical protein
MRNRDMSQEALEAALLAENRARCQPPLPDDEVKAIARSVSRYAAADTKPGKPKTLRRMDIGAMIATEPPPVAWAVEDLLVEGALTTVAGREGVGKSLFAFGMGVAACKGEPLAGFDARPSRVAYIDAENGEREIHRRIHALGLPPEVASQLSVYSVRGFDLRSNLDELEAILASEKPGVLILDSFRSLWGGDENDSGQVSQVLDPVRNLVRDHGAATLLLHHSPKGSSDYRGSSSIGASSELVFVLGRHNGDPDRDRRYLDCRKCRPAPEPEKRWLRLSADMGMVLIDEAEAFLPPEDEHERPPPKHAALSTKVLEVLNSAGPSELPLSRAGIARRSGRDTKDGSVGRVLDALVKAEKILRDSGGYAPKEGAKVPNPLGNGTLAPSGAGTYKDETAPGRLVDVEPEHKRGYDWEPGQ